MHGKLFLLRSRLQSLRARRMMVRTGSAVCAILLLMAGLWAAAFVLDVSLWLSWGTRVAVLVGWIAAVAWGCRRFAWPALTTQDSVEDLALLVERQHEIDSDLIGALQFETAAAQHWGSPRLSSAVIDHVAETSSELNVFQGFTYHPLPRWIVAASVMALAMIAASLCLPGQASAFWNRFWLGSARYPSRTVISELTVNGQKVEAVSQGKIAEVRLPQGSPLKVQMVCQGQIPQSATVRLQNRADRAEVQFDLKPQDGDPGRFLAEHALPSSDVLMTTFAGDTWSDPVALRIVPLPIVDVQWDITPPAYASTTESRRTGSAAKFLSVLAGSKLQISVRGTNKPLSRAELHFDQQVVPLITASGSSTWMLPFGSPLDAVHQGGTYEIHAVDGDGLSLTPPITGNIHLQRDRPPLVTLAAYTKLVIPTAKPMLSYSATDDYGLSQVRLHIEVVRSTGETKPHRQRLREFSSSSPVPMAVQGETRLDLAPFRLNKGDELRLTAEAFDHRGELTPQTGSSEPLVLKVTDRGGILSGLNEADQATAKQLDAIIQRELGIGGHSR